MASESTPLAFFAPVPLLGLVAGGIGCPLAVIFLLARFWRSQALS